MKMSGERSTWADAFISSTNILCFYGLRGKDIAPSGNLSTEGIPKSISRILDAAKIREEFKQRKRTALDDPSGGSGRPKKKRKPAVEATHEKDDATPNGKGSEKASDIKIQPGETLAHFNR